MEIPPELAQQLFRDGAFLIIAGVPIETEFGIDLNKYEVGDRFRGVKMIPAGPHYVYTAAKGPYGDSSARVGFIHYFHPQEILIREWDAEKEELRQRTKIDGDLEIRRIRENLKELDSFLASYDFETLSKWKDLTTHISNETIRRAMPLCGVIRPSAEFESCPDEDRPKGTTPQRPLYRRFFQTEEEFLPNMKIVPGTAPRFTTLPDRCPPDLTPAEISLCYLDCKQAIDQLFKSFSRPIDLLDELEFSFILFLAGCSVDGLAHWRKILGLLCNSETAVQANVDFYRKYLTTLQYQLPELPEELMEPTEYNTVYKDVRKLIANCCSAGLKEPATYLGVNLKLYMHWEFDDVEDEDPEDRPVVVEMS